MVDVRRTVVTYLLLFALQVRCPQLLSRYYDSCNTYPLRRHKVCPVDPRDLQTCHVSFSAFQSQVCSFVNC